LTHQRLRTSQSLNNNEQTPALAGNLHSGGGAGYAIVVGKLDPSVKSEERPSRPLREEGRNSGKKY
jgi:hypothetical protein